MLVMIAYLSLFFLGAMNITGVTLIEIAADFKEEVHVIGYFFAIMSVGCLVALLFAPKVVKCCGIKKIGIFSCLFLFLGYVGMCVFKNYCLYAFFMFLIGMGNGFLSFLANYIVSNYDDVNERKIKMSRMHFFFTLGAIISPFVAGYAIKNGLEWEFVYLGLLVVLLFLIFLIIKADFFKLEEKILKEKECYLQVRAKKDKTLTNYWQFDLFTWMIAGAFLLYVFAENLFANWVGVYLKEKTMADMMTASIALSCFWLFMALGRFFSTFIVRKISLSIFILGSCFLAMIVFFLMFFVEKTAVVYVMAVSFGFACSGIYAALFAFGTEKYENPSSETITLYVLFSALGSVLSFVLAGMIKNFGGIFMTMILGFIALAFLLLLVVLASMNREICEKQAVM